MVSVVQKPEKSITESGCYDEEIVLEELGMDPSRTSQSIVQTTSQEIPLMPMRMEITSIEDIGNSSIQGEESSEVERREDSGSEGKEMIEGKFYDALDKFLSLKKTLPKTM